jgi:hypothetical protein
LAAFALIATGVVAIVELVRGNPPATVEVADETPPTSPPTTAPADAPPPETTAFFGTVTTADGSDAQDTSVRVISRSLQGGGAQASTGRLVGGEPPASGELSKIWTDRIDPSAAGDTVTGSRETSTIPPPLGVAGEGGIWLVDGIALLENWEVSFSKPGYDTQRVVVSPPDSGDRVEINIELQPGVGRISGTIRDNTAERNPVGGVLITATDGEVTISTKSSSTNDPGTFSLEALSTPADYTLTFSKDGFGTEIYSYQLGPKGVRDDQAVEMQAGVGSISGTVRQLGGGPVGGAVVVATLGDKTYTTTTFTTGSQTGRYLLPRLPISATDPYTVSVSAAGLVGAARPVVVDGAKDNQNFLLKTSTGGIFGRVVDDAGQPISSATVTIKRDDVEFSVPANGSTSGSADDGAGGGGTTDPPRDVPRTEARVEAAVGGQPGSFAIDNLPPGEYVLTAERYNFETFSTPVVIVAGPIVRYPRNNGDIVLKRLGPSADTTVGLKVVATFTDDQGNKDFVTDARITIASPHLAQPRTVAMPGKLPADFGEVAVGAYRITARDPLGVFREASGVFTVSAQNQLIEIAMRAPGPVSVVVVDRAGNQLDGYDLQLVNTLNPAQVIAGRVVPAAGTFQWESDEQPDEGTWRVTVVAHPSAGYFIGSQPLVGNLDTTNAPPMTFTINRTSPSRLKFTVKAVAYPRLNVSLFGAVGAAAGQNPTVALLTDPGTVTVSCADAPASPATAAKVGDVYQLSSAQALALDTNGDGQLGDCSVTGESGGRSRPPVVVAPRLQLGTDTGDYEHNLSLTLLAPAPTIRGTIQWEPDATLFETITSWRISAGNVVVDFPPQQAANAPAPLPTPRTEPINLAFPPADGSNPQPQFTLAPQQAFGTTDYQVIAGGFAIGTFALIVPAPGGQPVTATTAIDAQLVTDSDPADLDFTYDLVLSQPAVGTIAGCLTIVTNSGQYAHAATQVTADQPRSPSLNLNVVIPAAAADSPPCQATPAVSSYAIPAAPAGNWSISFVPPPNHVERPPATPRTFRLAPSERRLDIDATFVEQATLDVTVQGDDGRGPAPTGLTGSVTISDGLLTAPRTEAVGPATTAIQMIPVALDDPATSTAYRLALAPIAGYDISQAVVTINGVTYDPNSTGRADARSIPFSVRAGDRVAVTVTLPTLGALTGTVEVVPWRDVPQTSANERATTSMIDPGSLTVQLCRYAALDQATLDTSGTCLPAAVTATGQFSFNGADGYYRVLIAHPLYRTDGVTPPVAPPTQWTAANPPPFPVYRVAIRTTNALAAPFEVQPHAAQLDLTVLADPGNLTRPGALVTVPNATVSLRRAADGADIVIDPASPLRGSAVLLPASDVAGWNALGGRAQLIQLTADGNGRLVLPNLPPDDYLLDVTSPISQLHYPVTVPIELPLNAVPAERLLRVTAISPVVGGRINAQIFVVNANWDGSPLPNTAFSVPVPTELLTVTRTYQPDPATVAVGQSGTPTTILPAAVSANGVAVTTPTGTAQSPVVATAAFTGLPGGDHTFSKPAGEPAHYRLIESPGVVTLSRSNPSEVINVRFVYQVASVDLSVALNDGAALPFPTDIGLTATLRYDGAPIPDIPASTTLVDGAFVFPDVPPKSVYTDDVTTTGYSVTVSSQLHTTTTRAVDLPATAGTNPGFSFPFGITATKGIITGSVQQNDGATGIIAMAADKTIGVVHSTGGTINDAANSYTGTGTYRYFVPFAGSYTVTANPVVAGPRSAYTSDDEPATVTLGRITTGIDLQIAKRALVTVTIATPPATTTVAAATAAPPTAPSIAGVSSSPTSWQLLLDPGVQHWIVANAGDPANFRSNLLITNGEAYGAGTTPAIGLSPPIAFHPLATLAGSVSNAGTTTITAQATRAGGGTVQGVVTGSAFAFTNALDTGTWTLRVEALGGGVLTGTFEVTGADVVVTAPFTRVNADRVEANGLSLTRRTITVNVTRRDAVSSAALGSPVGVTLTEAGTLTYQPFTTVPLSFAGYLDATPTITLASGDVATDTAVTVNRDVAMIPSPTISGTVAGYTGQGNNLTITIRTSACSTTGTTLTGKTPTIGAEANSLIPFSFTGANSVQQATTFCLIATQGNRTGQVQITVTAGATSATVTPAPAAITIS